MIQRMCDGCGRSVEDLNNCHWCAKEAKRQAKLTKKVKAEKQSA